jgi:magnesium chelatase subunit D
VEALGLFAVDPHGLGGVMLHARAGPVRDRWLAALRESLPEATPMRRIPLQIGDGRLLGGLDLAATLSLGRPVAERGLLAEVDGGVAVVAMAERVEVGVAARLGAALDHGEIRLERDGFAERFAARFGVVALDESADEDESVPVGLRERLAFLVDLSDIPLRDAIEPAVDRERVEAARACLAAVTLEDRWLEALCSTASSLGVDSPRAALAAVRAARASAALSGRDAVDEDDAALAARLVFAPRATRIPPDPSAEPPSPEPAPEPAQAEEPPPDAPKPEEQKADAPDADDPPPENEPEDDEADQRIPEEMLLEAARAAIPAGLLAQLQAQLLPNFAGRSAGGRSGAAKCGQRRGRPSGSRPGEPRGGARIAVVDALRAAAPWQALRRQERARTRPTTVPAGRRIEVRCDDFRVQRYRERVQTTTIFAVDASGSQALNRLAEAKGAVELLLADCYVRRDQVALIAFRGAGAEVMLPPTRSLARAKRSLAGLPGGGGTPLASGIDASRVLVDSVRRKGDSAVLIMMTDGRGNLARDGTPDRERAQSDAMEAAAQLRARGIRTLLIDTAARPHPAARKIADAMGARYLALPYADAAALSGAVKIAVASGAASAAPKSRS